MTIALGIMKRISPEYVLKNAIEDTYLYSVSIYILMLSYYFWQIRTDIKPEQPESSQSEQSEQKK